MMSVPRARGSNLATDSATVVASTVIEGLLWFAFVTLVARAGGPDARGVMAFTMAVPTLLQFASTLGLETANLFFGAKDASERRELVSVSILGGALLGASCALLCGLLFSLVPQLVPASLATRFLLLSLAVTMPATVQYLLIALLIASRKTSYANAIRLVIPAISTLGLALFLLSGAPLDYRPALVFYASGYLMGAVVACSVAIRQLGFANPSESVAAARRYLSYGIRAHVGKLAEVASFRLDYLVLAATKDPAALGIYAAAVNLAEVALYVPTSVSQLLLSNAARSPAEATGILLRRVLVLVLALVAFGAGFGILFAPAILQLTFGESFVASSTPLRILLVAMFGMTVRRILWPGLAARWRQGLASLISLATLILVVALDLILIPRYGPAGAAGASFLAYWTGGVLMFFVFRRIYPATSQLRVRDLLTDVQTVFDSVLVLIGRRKTSPRGDDEKPRGDS